MYICVKITVAMQWIEKHKVNHILHMENRNAFYLYRNIQYKKSAHSKADFLRLSRACDITHIDNTFTRFSSYEEKSIMAKRCVANARDLW